MLNIDLMNLVKTLPFIACTSVSDPVYKLMPFHYSLFLGKHLYQMEPITLEEIQEQYNDPTDLAEKDEYDCILEGMSFRAPDKDKKNFISYDSNIAYKKNREENKDIHASLAYKAVDIVNSNKIQSTYIHKAALKVLLNIFNTDYFRDVHLGGKSVRDNYFKICLSFTKLIPTEERIKSVKEHEIEDINMQKIYLCHIATYFILRQFMYADIACQDEVHFLSKEMLEAFNTPSYLLDKSSDPIPRFLVLYYQLGENNPSELLACLIDYLHVLFANASYTDNNGVWELDPTIKHSVLQFNTNCEISINSISKYSVNEHDCELSEKIDNLAYEINMLYCNKADYFQDASTYQVVALKTLDDYEHSQVAEMQSFRDYIDFLVGKVNTISLNVRSSGYGINDNISQIIALKDTYDRAFARYKLKNVDIYSQKAIKILEAVTDDYLDKYIEIESKFAFPNCAKFDISKDVLLKCKRDTLYLQDALAPYYNNREEDEYFQLYDKTPIGFELQYLCSDPIGLFDSCAILPYVSRYTYSLCLLQYYKALSIRTLTDKTKSNAVSISLDSYYDIVLNDLVYLCKLESEKKNVKIPLNYEQLLQELDSNAQDYISAYLSKAVPNVTLPEYTYLRTYILQNIEKLKQDKRYENAVTVDTYITPETTYIDLHVDIFYLQTALIVAVGRVIALQRDSKIIKKDQEQDYIEAWLAIVEQLCTFLVETLSINLSDQELADTFNAVCEATEDFNIEKTDYSELVDILSSKKVFDNYSYYFEGQPLQESTEEQRISLDQYNLNKDSNRDKSLVSYEGIALEVIPAVQAFISGDNTPTFLYRYRYSRLDIQLQVSTVHYYTLTQDNLFNTDSLNVYKLISNPNNFIGVVNGANCFNSSLASNIKNNIISW